MNSFLMILPEKTAIVVLILLFCFIRTPEKAFGEDLCVETGQKCAGEWSSCGPCCHKLEEDCVASCPYEPFYEWSACAMYCLQCGAVCSGYCSGTTTSLPKRRGGYGSTRQPPLQK